jgi:hypothetical protein
MKIMRLDWIAATAGVILLSIGFTVENEENEERKKKHFIHIHEHIIFEHINKLLIIRPIIEISGHV